MRALGSADWAGSLFADITTPPPPSLANLFSSPPPTTHHLYQNLDQQALEEFEDFYEEVFEELSKFGEVEELHVCDNLGDHMVSAGSGAVRGRQRAVCLHIYNIIYR